MCKNDTPPLPFQARFSRLRPSPHGAAEVSSEGTVRLFHRGVIFKCNPCGKEPGDLAQDFG